jgi:hypothetical protein
MHATSSRYGRLDDGARAAYPRVALPRLAPSAEVPRLEAPVLAWALTGLCSWGLLGGLVYLLLA